MSNPPAKKKLKRRPSMSILRLRNKRTVNNVQNNITLSKRLSDLVAICIGDDVIPMITFHITAKNRFLRIIPVTNFFEALDLTSKVIHLAFVNDLAIHFVLMATLGSEIETKWLTAIPLSNFGSHFNGLPNIPRIDFLRASLVYERTGTAKNDVILSDHEAPHFE
jgi:hypothetical protein